MRGLPLALAVALLSVLTVPAFALAQASDVGSAPPARFGLSAADLNRSALTFLAVPSGGSRDKGHEAAADAGSPLSFGVEYAVLSDFIFRGMNLSEHAREGREKLNHRLDTWIDADVGRLFGKGSGTLGTLSLAGCFVWYGDQKKLDPVGGGQNLYVAGYLLSWKYEWEPVATTFTLGYNFYSFPNRKASNTHEWTFLVDHNDAWMWKGLWPENEEGVLNPSFFFAQDVQSGPGTVWMEIGFSHEFAVAEHVALTPCYKIAIDHGYVRSKTGTGRTDSTGLAFMQYGLTIDFDMASAFAWPEAAGGWTVSTFLYFNDALGNVEDNDVIQDEFYGGVAVEWSF